MRTLPMAAPGDAAEAADDDHDEREQQDVRVGAGRIVSAPARRHRPGRRARRRRRT